jgi:hypothetical protein
VVPPVASYGSRSSDQPCLVGVAQPLVDLGQRRHGVDVGVHGVSLRGSCWVCHSLRRRAAHNIGTVAGIACPIGGTAASASTRARRELGSWPREDETSIRHLADEVVGRPLLSAVMEVHIWLDQSEPPVGRLTATGAPDAPEPAGRTVPFTGWLGLLRALSDAMDVPADGPTST